VNVSKLFPTALYGVPTHTLQAAGYTGFVAASLATGALIGCTVSQLTAMGADPATAAQVVTVEQSVVDAGTLFCKPPLGASGVLYEVANVVVTGALPGPVASVCGVLAAAGTIAAGSVPGPAVAGAAATVVTAPAVAAAAVKASVRAGA
jgi:hypothetical protein